MVAAWLLTVAAFAGIAIGMSGRAPRPSGLLAAAAGGLLAGICLFWVLPEIAHRVGAFPALLLILAVAAALLILDQTLLPHGHGAKREILAPLLLATAVHSFLDGWSVRALSINPMDRVVVALGLGLHKIPEGIAVGWIVRRGLGRSARSASIAGGVELATPLGAWVEPLAQRAGFVAFGTWWTAFVLAVVGGAFLFVGVHAIADERGNIRALVMFALTFALVGALSFAGVSV